jgi:cell division protein FtsI (penicillin-binding protein 3)
MSRRTYRTLTPVPSDRTARAQTRRGNHERDRGLRRVDAAVTPHGLAMKARVHAVLLVFFLGWAAILGRAGWLALGPDPRLENRVVSQHERVIDVAAQRGAIVDRMGRPLAISVELGSVFADPQLIEDAEATADLLAPLLDMPRPELLEKLTRTNRFVWLGRQVSTATADGIEELDLPGVRLIAEAHRDYPSGPLAAQILGFVGTDGEGLEGLEARFDSTLMGDGYQYTVLRDGRRRAINHDALLGRRSTEGDTVVLTLDHSIQHRAEHALAAAIEKHDAEAGMAVVIDVQTGALLALASLPSFDPNHIRGVARELFRHQAVGTVFEPGSTMKPFVFAELIEQDLIERDEEVFCENGAYRIGRRTVHDAHPYGTLTADEVLKVSSNIGTTKLGERLGPAKLEAAYRRFGFGSKTGVELYGEERGILHKSGSWSRIGFATHTFGQGMAVTSVQLTSAFASLVNGGHKLQPHLVAEVRDLDGRIVEDRRPVVTAEPLISESTSADLREMLAGVMEEGGTGGRARLDEYSAGGKTGTAQKVKGGRYAPGVYVSSFLGFAPVENPRVATFVVLDEPKDGHYGGTVAGPAFAEITTHALRELGVAPDRPKELEPLVVAEQADEADETPTERTFHLDADVPVMPDLTGLSARDALVAVHEAGLELELDGSGLVATQEPEAGEPITPSTTVRLSLAGRGAR